jgi:hypothetical protein
MTFTKPEQTKHRKAFIEECRQKAWGAACHADWIGKSLDQLAEQITKRQKEDAELDAAIKAAEVAPVYHTVESRNKRKAMQTRRDQLFKELGLIRDNLARGQQSLQGLYQSMESNLELAKFAEVEWKEPEAAEEPENITTDDL